MVDKIIQGIRKHFKRFENAGFKFSSGGDYVTYTQKKDNVFGGVEPIIYKVYFDIGDDWVYCHVGDEMIYASDQWDKADYLPSFIKHGEIAFKKIAIYKKNFQR